MKRFKASRLVCGAGWRAARGFTLIESILAIGVLALVSAALLSMLPRVWAAQQTEREHAIGLELQKGCAERLLAIRRKLGYANVTNTLCDGMGGLAAYAANPSVVLLDAGGSVVTACATATCTASVTIGKTGLPSTLPALTLQFSVY